MGAHLRRAREQRGLSALEVQELTRIDPTSLSKMENDQRKVSAENLRLLAEAYHIDVNLLASGRWDTPLTIFSYPTNPHPYRLDHVIVDKVCMLFGNHTDPIDFSI